jgi:hypothetical protein
MGFDTHMIAGSRACSTSTQPIHPTITSQTNPHYAEALAGTPAFSQPLTTHELPYGSTKGSPLGDFAVCGGSYAAGRMV